MRKIIPILSIAILVIFSVLFFIRDDREININKDISVESMDIKQLTPLVSPYVSEYYDNEDYHLGGVSIQSTNGLKGEIKLTFASDSGSKSEVVEVQLDSELNKLISLTSLGTDDVLNPPGVIHPESWNYDYTQAFDIAKKFLLEKNNKLEYDQVLVSTKNRNSEYWEFRFQNLKSFETYWCFVDPYTGQVIDSGLTKTK
ncbi:hypothetical protein [Paenibacillus sp. LHD-38]|uniref:hypothetical protein n=1 Tax=Paenibacillus sp. LHD-38 TaxID=3072143 RepID=UPI00280DA457|nr:hypothetical protein [Paenibacillus sp. LHD-38]MDQ8734828.1 hypothetical protein [Paenibacillus sp. LHD-38]